MASHTVTMWTYGSRSPCHQHQMHRLLPIRKYGVVLCRLSPLKPKLSRARLIATAAPSSGAFLQVIPMSSVGTRLDNTSMRIAVSLRLGAPLSTPHDCIRGAAVESSGVHAWSELPEVGRSWRQTHSHQQCRQGRTDLSGNTKSSRTTRTCS